MNAYLSIGQSFLKTHLNTELYNYQHPIVQCIMDMNIRRATIRAATRSGKSFIVGNTLIAFACIYSNSRIGIIAPSKDKTKIIMTYILEALSTSDLEPLIDLDIMGLTRMERLKREVSKTKITFKNGSSIEIKTADVKNKGFSLMGAGYDLVVIDESAELTSEVWTKIARMLLESPDTKLVELYNPWFLNHTYEHTQDPDWTVIKIDYNDCLKDGRFTREQVDMVMQEIQNPIDRRVLLDAEFPDANDNSLFNYADIIAANREIQDIKATPEKILAIDVARKGLDDTIVYLIYRWGSLFVVKKMWKLDKQRLTKSAGDIIDLIEKETPDLIKIDSTGIGAGLEDNLKEYLDNSSCRAELIPIVFSEKADDIHNLNRKADIYFNLRNIYNNKSIITMNDPVLARQLRNMQYEIKSNGKKGIIDNQSKSPDRADALAIGCYVTKNQSTILIGDTFI